MICYHCGESVPDETTHCYYCGAPLNTKRKNDYADSIDDLVDSRPQRFDYDDLVDYEPTRSRALPLALSVVAAILIILAGIYLLSQSNSKKQRQDQLNQLTLPSTDMKENVPLVMVTEQSDQEREMTKTNDQPDTNTKLTSASEMVFNPPTLPEYVPVDLPQQTSPPTVQLTTPQANQVSPGGGKTYTVVAGDSFWSVATKQYGQATMELAEFIAAANGRSASDGLQVNEVLIIPPQPATPTAQPVARVSVNHLVTAGESFWSIASKYYGNATSALAEKVAQANGRTAAAGVKTGETIIVPDVPQNMAPSTGQVPPPAPAATAPTGGQTYLVKQGDSYWSISEFVYGTANYPLAEKIAAANGRTINDRLNVGETLVIPPR